MTIITNFEENKTIFIPCDCRSEILMIKYDHELKIADLAIYESFYSNQYKMSLWHRLVYCWRILVQKKLYVDQINLNHKHLKELKTFLSSLNLGV